MTNYLLAYTGGGMAPTEAEQEAVMKAWTEWFGGLGETLVDPGNPFALSSSVSADGSVSHGGGSGLTTEVYETMQVM